VATLAVLIILTQLLVCLTLSILAAWRVAWKITVPGGRLSVFKMTRVSARTLVLALVVFLLYPTLTGVSFLGLDVVGIDLGEMLEDSSEE
jgi:hypothetical protein